ncbi:MAG: hypothetical protein HZB65_02155 [Candidatus Aenigmarchaeota archaeon]|nr:hypothetical protein [Candidatus Aenigmarchaeota archaeon]
MKCKISLFALFAAIFIIFIMILSWPVYALIADTTTVSLNKGWNLVSAPHSDFAIAKPENSNGADCDMQTIKLIYHYDSEAGKYIKIDSFEKITPGQGYWVYSPEQCEIEFSGNEFTEINNKELKKGWNMIGGADLLNIDDYTGCEIKAIYNYDSETEKFYKTSAFLQGKGYWIYAKDGCVLHKSLPKAYLLVADKTSLTENENNFYEQLKTYSETVLVLPDEIDEINADFYIFIADYYKKVELQGDSINVVDKDQGLYFIYNKQNDQQNFVIGFAAAGAAPTGSGDGSSGGVVVSERTRIDKKTIDTIINKQKNIIFVGNGKKYKSDQDSADYGKYAEIPIKREINSSELLKNVGEKASFVIPNDGFLRDKNGDLYLIFNYVNNKAINVEGLKDADGDQFHKFKEVNLIGVGAAVSKDTGKTWKYLAKNEKFFEPQPLTATQSWPEIASEDIERCKLSWDKIVLMAQINAEGCYFDNPANEECKKLREMYNKFLLTKKYEYNKCNHPLTPYPIIISDSNSDYHTAYPFEKGYANVRDNENTKAVYLGTAAAENGIYVFYGLYQKQGKRKCSYVPVPFSKVSVDNNPVLANYANGYANSCVDEGASEQYELRRLYVQNDKTEDIIISNRVVNNVDNSLSKNMKFIGYYKNKQYFSEDDKLYESDDGGKTLMQKGYYGYKIRDSDGREYVQQVNNIVDINGMLIGAHNEYLYIQKGEYFEQIGKIGADNIDITKPDMSITPVLRIIPDSLGNLHVLFTAFSGQDEAEYAYARSLFYQLIPNSYFTHETPYDSVRIITGSSCAKCQKLKEFLSANNIAFLVENDNLIKEPVIKIRKSGTETVIREFNKAELAKALGIGFIEEIDARFNAVLPLDSGCEFLSNIKSGHVVEHDSFYDRYEGAYDYNLDITNRVCYAFHDNMPLLNFDQNENPFILVAKKDDGLYKYEFSDRLDKSKLFSISNGMRAIISSGENAEILLEKRKTDIKKDDVRIGTKTRKTMNLHGAKGSLINAYSDVAVLAGGSHLFFKENNKELMQDMQQLKNVLNNLMNYYHYYGISYIGAIYEEEITYSKRSLSSQAIFNYDFYSYKPGDTRSTITVSQFIPGGVFYAPVEEGEEIGEIEGELAKYVVETKIATDDGRQYLFVKADISKYLAAMDGDIPEERILGYVYIGKRKSDLVINVANTPLKASNPDAEYPIYLSQETAQSSDGAWYVVNNLAIKNKFCGLEMKSNSYQVLTEKDILEKGLDKECLEAMKSDIYDIDCSIEELKEELSVENMHALDSSLTLYTHFINNRRVTNYELFFGKNTAQIYRAVEFVSDCELNEKEMALLAFEGRIITEDYNEDVYDPVISEIVVV